MTTQPQLHVTVVRHGETNSNLKRILQGHINTILNKTGREQSELVSHRLRKMKFDHIYTSDLSRTKKTAEIIAKNHPDVPLTEDIRLRERDLGRLSGLSIYKALDLIKEEELTWSDYGESDEDFKAQVVDFFNDMIAKHLPRNDGSVIQSSNSKDSLKNKPGMMKRNPHVLIVTHGGTINKLVKEHLIMDLGFFVNNYLSMKHKAKNSSVTKFVVRRIDDPSSITTDDDDDATSVISSNTAENESVIDDSGSEKATQRNIERKIRIEGDVTLWSCVSHLSSQGKRTHGDSQIDDYVH
ncbi:5603_t:CDS:2 [Diversispora eburnea]|uniref:5603_t:CDS:1 n=1 Tax=Diversispora eburnea TaxID=1213867 RepID=A0A9N8VH79_9GLOM|nr:5603_t:CDS:2 [Diversispora eburnea]